MAAIIRSNLVWLLQQLQKLFRAEHVLKLGFLKLDSWGGCEIDMKILAYPNFLTPIYQEPVLLNIL